MNNTTKVLHVLESAGLEQPLGVLRIVLTKEWKLMREGPVHTWPKVKARLKVLKARIVTAPDGARLWIATINAVQS